MKLLRPLLAALAVAAVSLIVGCDDDDNANVPPTSGMTIKTLSNRADLISGGYGAGRGRARRDSCPAEPQGRSSTAPTSRRRSRRTRSGRILGLVTGLKNGDEHDHRRRDRRQLRSAPASSITNHPIGGPVLLGAQTHAVDLRDADAGRRRRQHAGIERERPVDDGDRRAVQHRDRIQALLSHQTRRTAGSLRLVRLPDPSPAGTAHAGQPASSRTSPGTTPAGLGGLDDDQRRRHRAVHRARRARHAQPRHLRHRRAVRSDQAGVDGDRAAAAMERQGLYTFGASTGQPRLQFRTEQNWADDAGAVARLHGRRQQPDRLALQLEPRRSSPRR